MFARYKSFLFIFIPIFKLSPQDYANMLLWTLRKIKEINAASSISMYFGWTEKIYFSKVNVCVYLSLEVKQLCKNSMLLLFLIF